MSELFPELDDAPAQPQEQPPASPSVHREIEARINRPGLAAGIESIARFEQAFGLPGMIRSLKKTDGDEIELVVELPDGQLVSGSLVPPGTRAWKQGKSFGRTASLNANARLRWRLNERQQLWISPVAFLSDTRGESRIAVSSTILETTSLVSSALAMRSRSPTAARICLRTSSPSRESKAFQQRSSMSAN